MTNARSRPSSRRAAAFLAVPLTLLTALGTAPVSAQATTGTGAPALSLQHTIRTSTFLGSKVSMKDHEGSVYVPRDNSLWLADDDGQRLYEVNARSGRLKRTIGVKALMSVRRFQGAKQAGRARTRDLESLAYDAARDRLYAFSGSDCKPSTDNCEFKARPTVFRLTRVAGRLRLHSFQPLKQGTQTTASAWRPRGKRLFVGDEEVIRGYSYKLNKFGPAIRVPGLKDILGMDFTGKGANLLVTYDETLLSRVPWRTKSVRWTLDLAPFGVRDARSVERVRGQLFISDGYDYRPAKDPLRHAVFIF